MTLFEASKASNCAEVASDIEFFSEEEYFHRCFIDIARDTKLRLNSCYLRKFYYSCSSLESKFLTNLLSFEKVNSVEN